MQQSIKFISQHGYMKKLALLCCFASAMLTTFCQATKPKIDIYAAPGIFIEGLNNNVLVPKSEQDGGRIGDDASFGAVVNLPVRKGIFMVKAGLGYHEMHYSMSKYSIGDFIGALFLFDAPYSHDTFPISRVRFTNKYLEVPLAFAFHISHRRNDLNGLSVGVYVKPSFLLNSHADITADTFASRTPPSPGLQRAYQKLYTQDATKFTLIVQPYIEWSFNINNGLGFITQIRPLSWYSSPLNKKFTNFTAQLFGFTAGVVYDFNR